MSTVLADVEQGGSITARIRAWMRAAIESEQEVRLSDLADQALSEFGSSTEAQDALMRPALYDLARRVVAETRSITPTAWGGVRRGAVDTAAVAFQKRFSSWMEHVDDKHMLLADMRGADLKIAATERRERGRHEFRVAAFLDRLREALSGRETVGERLSASDITAAWIATEGAN